MLGVIVQLDADWLVSNFKGEDLLQQLLPAARGGHVQWCVALKRRLALGGHLLEADDTFGLVKAALKPLPSGWARSLGGSDVGAAAVTAEGGDCKRVVVGMSVGF